MLLIITPSKFLSAIGPLKTHKEQTGILTDIITLEDVYKNYPKGDQAEKVKRCIADGYQRQGHRFVMLVGDSDVFPVRFTKTDRGDQNAANTAFYPTDLYYAALYKKDGSFDDWDSNRNGYYGELNGETHTGPINIDQVNLTPTVAVGRVPASTLDEANRYVQKVIRFEQQAYGAAWAKKALLMATNNWIADACRVQERIAQNYLKGYQSTFLFSTGSPCSGAGGLIPSAVTDGLNRGVGLVGYIGHGAPDSLQIPAGFWGIGNIPQLTNVNRTPIMVASACSTGEFATLPPYSSYVDINNMSHKGSNNGERFTSPPPQPACLQTLNDPDNDLATNLTVRTDAGVVAYLGGVTGMQMCEPLEYFFQGLPSCATVGEAWQWMVKHYYEVQGLPGSLSSPDWVAVARVHQPWKFMLFGDPSLRIGGAAKGLWSWQQLTSGDRGTSHGPASAVHQNKLYMVWKGKLDDPRIFFSAFDGSTWSPQYLTSGDRGTSHGPALAVFKNKLYMVWKGKLDDPRIFFSTFDGSTWSPQYLTSGDRGTSHTPALAVYQNKLYMVWKGKLDDPRIFFSTFDGSTWSPQYLTSGDRGTSHGPALAVYQNKLYMVWKGKQDDPRIFFSTFDGSTWSPQYLTSGDRGTSHGPALAVYKNKLYMIWKGKQDDPRIFLSTFDGSTWSPQYLTSGDRGTSEGPALSVYLDKLFMVWKGKLDDPMIFYSYLYRDS
jgi:hypothetical protein